jgi:hypothetical protein
MTMRAKNLRLLCAAAIISAVSAAAVPGSTNGAPGASQASAFGYSHSEELPIDDHAKAVPASRFPLNGLNDNAAREVPRPVMVMVENSAAARPQSGLDQADLVYEILAEGNITRFVAVYQSRAPQVVGPVRSIRPYFVEIGDGLDAIIVHAGWSQDAMNMIADRQLNHFDQVYGDSAYYWRSGERKAPHNLYTAIDLVRKGAGDRRMRSIWKGTGLAFEQQGTGEGSEPAGTRPAGVDAVSVLIPYIGGYTAGYRYDPATRLYNREMNGETHRDKETGHALTAANILICKSKHRIVDSDGRRDVDVFGPGVGYLVQKGQAREVTWQRQAGMIRAYADGAEVELLPGQTWVQVVPETSGVTFGPL